MLKLKNEINFNIIKRLKSHRKSSQFKSFKIKLDNILYKLIKDKYKLNCRYKSNYQFIEDHGIVQQRFINQEDFCQIDKNNFEINISIGKTIKYLDDKLQEKKIKESPTIGIRFCVEKCKRN